MFKKNRVLFDNKPEMELIQAPVRSRGPGIKEMNGNNDARQNASTELTKLASESARVILDIKAVFPFNFFPDELMVDETKVSIHTNFFFYNKQVRSIEYSDIFNVVIQEGLFFAKLEIVDRYFSEQSITIEYLKKKDAVLARRIIQGMIIAKKKNIDLRSLPIHELMQKLDRIGQSR